MFDSEEAFEAWWQDAVAASARGELHTWSEEEIERHPLFCSNVPEDISSNPGLVAMQNLIYDEPPETVATTFKSNGNEALTQGKLQDAVVFYTKGLEMDPIPAKLRSTLFGNRAQAHLKLRKYPEAFSDARKALYLDSTSTKAAYRGAIASQKLNLWKDGLVFVTRGLAVCETNEQKLFEEYKEIFSEQKKIHEKLQANIFSISASESILNSILSERNISLTKQVYTYPGNTKAAISLNEEDKQSLLFPILILYDEFNQSDWLLSVHESASIEDIHQTLFESVPEWIPPSRVAVYSDVSNLNFYLEFHNPANIQSQHLVQVAVDATLDAITRNKTLIGFPVLHAIAKDRKDDIDTLLHQHTLLRS